MNAVANAIQSQNTSQAVKLCGPLIPAQETVLTPQALELVMKLHREFEPRRQALLQLRTTRQAEIDAGARPDFLPETAVIRNSDWRIASVPADLQDRRVEITGPVDRKMIINALNTPVQCFMADFEDSNSPTWSNIVAGQINLRDAVERTIAYTDPASGKQYRLGTKLATLIVRPRGWHLSEKHVLVDGQPVSGSLFDFAVFLANNHVQLRRNGSGPYFYLPKMENHLEARLWNDVFKAAQEALGIAQGTIKATVLIETILAAFEMDEILYELREHIVGLNCGRWDYIFSFIKKFRLYPAFVMPDRVSVTMESHFLKSYVTLLIRTCHRRGAHAMGGMAAQIPIRNDLAANEAAMKKVAADKQREANAGHDGTWIAHPGLADIARSAFDSVMPGPNQVDRPLSDVQITADDLLRVPTGQITEDGLRHNIRVGVQYLEAWLRGNGCVPLYDLMEDAATAEISRAQIWQWIHHSCKTQDGQVITTDRFERLLTEELARIHREIGLNRVSTGVFPTAARLFSLMAQSDYFDEFLTLPAYEHLD